LGPPRSLPLPPRRSRGGSDDVPRAGRRAPAPARDRALPPQGRRLLERTRTRVSERLGIRYPILQAGMIWASGYKLAVACAEADILGTIGSGSMKTELPAQRVRKDSAQQKR